MFPLLVFMFCFFIGSLAMFFYSLKKRESQFRSLSEEHAQLRVLLRAMESRLDNMEKYMAARAGFKNTAGEEAPEDACETDESQAQEPDPLLHLSFEEPGGEGRGGTYPNLEMPLDFTEKEK